MVRNGLVGRGRWGPGIAVEADDLTIGRTEAVAVTTWVAPNVIRYPTVVEFPPSIVIGGFQTTDLRGQKLRTLLATYILEMRAYHPHLLVLWAVHRIVTVVATVEGEAEEAVVEVPTGILTFHHMVQTTIGGATVAGIEIVALVATKTERAIGIEIGTGTGTGTGIGTGMIVEEEGNVATKDLCTGARAVTGSPPTTSTEDRTPAMVEANLARALDRCPCW